MFSKSELEEYKKKIENNIEQILKLVNNICTLDKGGSLQPRPGTTSEQISYAIDKINNIDAIYKERIESLGELKKDQDELKNETNEISVRMQNFCDKYGSDIYPDWLKKTYKIK